MGGETSAVWQEQIVGVCHDTNHSRDVLDLVAIGLGVLMVGMPHLNAAQRTGVPQTSLR